MNTKRIEWVDTLRAFAMFLIVLGHTLRGSSIYYVLYSFHVPLCIMISGFCFNPNRKWNEVLSRLIKRLYAPYLIFGAISICVYIAIAPIAEGHSVVANTPTYLLGLIYGNGNLGMSVGGYMRWNLPMWYIPCTIAVEIAAYLLIRTAGALLHCKEHIICLVGLTMSIIVSGLIPLESVDLPFGLETAFALLPFFLLGILLRIIWDNGIICVRGGGTTVMVAAFLIVIGILSQSTNSNVDYVCDHYGNNYFVFCIAAIMISVGCVSVAIYLPPWINNRFRYVGQNTLPILLMHKFPIMLYVVISGKLFPELVQDYPLPFSLVVSIFTMATCLIVGRGIEMVCPAVIGKTRKRSKANI